MLMYIASSVYNDVINTTIKNCNELITKAVNDNEFEFLKYVKQNIVQLGSLEKLVIDITALSDLDDEIVQAVEMIRSVYDNLIIIILAPGRSPGDEMLSKIFNCGIVNIVSTDDYVILKEELTICLTEGKKYRDAVVYKEVKKEKVVVKNEIKQTVEKVMLGFAGATDKIGVTHNSIIMANWLRKKGFMVAFVEYQNIYNQSDSKDLYSPFDSIRDSFMEKMIEDKYFTIGGVDYYPRASIDTLSNVLSRSYNFIVIDFGCFRNYDKIEYGRCAERFVISGSKPWEMESIVDFFDDMAGISLETTHFCFNHTHEDMYKGIKENMEEAESIHFLKYINDPFNSSDFADAENIMKKYMPVIIDEKKRGIVSRIIKKQR